MSQIFTNVMVAMLCCGIGFSQAPPRPSFDVADVQIHADKETPTNAQFLPGGRVDIRNLNMRQLVLVAFNIGQGVSEKLVEGIPGWADTTNYDIIAKADPKTSINTLRVMLQTLLADRFKMIIHREDRVMPVYALVVGKGSPKLQPAAGTDGFNCGAGEGAENMVHLVCRNMTMADLVVSLPSFAPRYFDSPVVNGTDITGAYDIKLDWTPAGATGARGPDGQHAPTDSADIAATTIFDAVQQLGFKLEKRKQPFPVVVVDRLERTPTDN
jgi:uncharacterized protein (TIGR03435 family)